jgi:tetratricopeptide (TPR) repeat protein
MSLDKSLKSIVLICMICFVIGCSQSDNARVSSDGNISFENSGSAAAQSAFLTGIKALHSFQFDGARIAFEEAQSIDPSFAMAYWGQAMSDNHPLWAQQDKDAASRALNRLAPSFEGRLAKAGSEKEKAYISAIEDLYYFSEDKLERDFAYSAALARMNEKWPDDHEISIFYALSLLGTMRPGDSGFARQAKAASIAMGVFAENENHPGAAHFTIHSLDDPDHAILALPAATVYANIAPSSAHALHMPSHIFLQLGMWERVVNSNIEAYAAAVSNNKKLGLKEGREDFHTLSWLAYANLMLGHHDRAEENVAMALAAVERNPGDTRVRYGYLNMLARHTIETGDCRGASLKSDDTDEGQHSAWVTAVGMCAITNKDLETARTAMERLSSLRMKTEKAGKSYNALQIQINEKSLGALIAALEGDLDEALTLAEEASIIELDNMSAPSGPPVPMKPAAEMYAEVLAAAGQYSEAITAYKKSLNWVPNRTPSIMGLAKVAELNGNNALAEEMRAKLETTPGINIDKFVYSKNDSLEDNAG